MIPTVAQLDAISGNNSNASNKQSIITALERFGEKVGLDKPHRLAHFLSQLAHESGGFRYDKEIWGPTPAQVRYDTRTDLGNTAAVDGDGERYAGRGPIQLTGKFNYTKFRDWARRLDASASDFVANPEAINTDPWEGLSAIWYWSAGNPTGKSLNAYSDSNDIEQVTKKINGGLNGYADRIRFYTRAAMVLLGRLPPTDIKLFQRWAMEQGYLPNEPDQADGDPGPKTRSALHMALVAKASPATAALPSVRAAPVVATEEVEVEVPVIAKGSDKRWPWWTLGLGGIGSSLIQGFGGLGDTEKLILIVVVVAGAALLLWQGERIIGRIKRLADSIGDPA